MKAGRELDARIAEEVMGWSVCRKGEKVDGPTLLRSSLKEGVATEDVYRYRDNPYSPFSLPHYSTRIQDAWLVVEKMTEEGFCPALLYDDDGRWALSTDGIQNLPGKGEVLYTSFAIESDMLADTAPLAICLAALAVVERRDDFPAAREDALNPGAW